MRHQLASRLRRASGRPARQRRIPAAVACAVLGVGLVAAGCHRAPPALSPTSPEVTRVTGVGFDEPENLVYDSVADVYLVSNIVGNPAQRDGDAFISRVSPDGHVLTLRWIADGTQGARLDAPKGLALDGDTLAVADLGMVRFFDRRTGAPMGTVSVPGLVLNDLRFAPDGSIWVTDTGPDRSTTPVDTSKDLDAVWHIAPNGSVNAVARGLALDRPDGIVLDGEGALVATFGAHRVERVGVGAGKSWETVIDLPGGKVDGMRRLPDGALVLTSWDSRTVWHARPGEKPRAILTGVTSPAGVAVDTRRDRLAVTSMQGNALYLVPLP